MDIHVSNQISRLRTDIEKNFENLNARVVVREGLQVLNLKCIDDKCYLTRIQSQ